MNHGENNAKGTILCWKTFRGAGTNEIKIELNSFILSIRGIVKRMKQEHTSTI